MATVLDYALPVFALATTYWLFFRAPQPLGVIILTGIIAVSKLLALHH